MTPTNECSRHRDRNTDDVTTLRPGVSMPRAAFLALRATVLAPEVPEGSTVVDNATLAALGDHDPTGADHLAEMMEHAERADRLEGFVRPLMAGLGVIEDCHHDGCLPWLSIGGGNGWELGEDALALVLDLGATDNRQHAHLAPEVSS